MNFSSPIRRLPICLALFLSLCLGACRGSPAPGEIRLGVEVRAVSPKESRANRILENGGVSIVRVFPDTPAEKAGLQPGDIIIQIDSAPLELKSENRAEEFAQTIRQTKKKKIKLTYIREKNHHTIEIHLK